MAESLIRVIRGKNCRSLFAAPPRRGLEFHVRASALQTVKIVPFREDF
jgi:hypothetical protein